MVGNTHIYFVAPLAALLTAGCARDSGRYPSLATRDAERAVGEFSPATPSEPAVISPANRASIGSALEQARSSHAQFLEDQPAALRLARSVASAADSADARSRALVALAGLTSLRGQTVVALANLDMLEVNSANEFGAVEDIRNAQTYIERLVGEQDQMLDLVAREIDR